MSSQASLAETKPSQQGTVSTVIKEESLPSTAIWFSAFYDPWRKGGGLTSQQCFKVASTSLISCLKVLISPHPGTWIGFGLEHPHDMILEDKEEILFETYAINHLKAIPEIPETKQLTTAWMNYLVSGKDLLTKYANAYAERKTNPDTWGKVKNERKAAEKHLRLVANENYKLEQEVRKANGLAPKHYWKTLLYGKTYYAIR